MVVKFSSPKLIDPDESVIDPLEKVRLPNWEPLSAKILSPKVTTPPVSCIKLLPSLLILTVPTVIELPAVIEPADIELAVTIPVILTPPTPLISPTILIPPTPVIDLLLRSKLPPNCGVVSSTTALIPPLL